MSLNKRLTAKSDFAVYETNAMIVRLFKSGLSMRSVASVVNVENKIGWVEKAIREALLRQEKR